LKGRCLSEALFRVGRCEMPVGILRACLIYPFGGA
jgi:hypothetical protein